jgi:glutamate dehydrogenase (NAD(P)+)
LPRPFGTAGNVGQAGGVICAAAEYRGAGHAEAFTDIREKIHDSTAELLDRLLHASLTPRAAADQMAHERLCRALALRRKF